MSEQAIPTPPGWYADPHGTATWRWWDGSAWSEQVSETLGKVVRPKLADGVNPNSLWSWLFAALPLFYLVTLFLMDFDIYEPPGYGVRFGVYDGEFLVSLGVTWAVWGAAAFIAYRDFRVLRERGVVRPFHWAWSFLAWIVYVIGRAVIVRKVSSRWKGPLWAVIIVQVAMWGISIAWIAVGLAGASAQLADAIPGVAR